MLVSIQDLLIENTIIIFNGWEQALFIVVAQPFLVTFFLAVSLAPNYHKYTHQEMKMLDVSSLRLPWTYEYNPIVTNVTQRVGCWDAPCLVINTKSGYFCPCSRIGKDIINTIAWNSWKNITRVKKWKHFDSKKELISANDLLQNSEDNIRKPLGIFERLQEDRPL